MLFAATGLLIGGFDDILVDLFYLFYRVRRQRTSRLRLLELAPPESTGRLAIFVPAWDEAAVIGGMIRSTLARFDHDDYRLYVGLYPNDPATIGVLIPIAECDSRVRLVIGDADGPTTKADNLNRMWAAAIARDGRKLKAVVLHDAEDVVHPAELRVFDSLIDSHDVVQLPVLPLVMRGSRLISGHYADEFAEHHTAQMPIRTALGAGMPLAGTGCSIARAALAGIAAERGGLPFDATSLTEDYELGLRIGERGGRCIFARVEDEARGGLVAVRAYFPATIPAATRQKARWMIGIALAGWDRVGWGRARDWREHWMRMRDRRAPIAVLVLIAAYLAALSWAISATLHAVSGTAPGGLSFGMAVLLTVNSGLLIWRLAVRAAFTARVYGWRQALLSLPRAVVGNFIALAAAQRALFRYVGMLRGAAPRWDKTAHVFPHEAEHG